MKALFFFFGLIGTFAFAQQPTPCDITHGEITVLVRDGEFDKAYDVWTAAGKCITEKETGFIDGEKILLNKLQRAKVEDKPEFVGKLVRNYDGHDKAFPANTSANSVKKAMLLKNQKAGTDEEIYQLLDRAYAKDFANFNDPTALYLYFELFFDRHKAEGAAASDEALFAKEDAISTKLKQLSDANPRNERMYATAIDGIRNLTEPIATCEKLLPYYSKSLEANKENAAWLEAVTTRLLYKTCPDTIMLLNVANAWHKTAPTPKSGYHLGLSLMRARQMEKAYEMFDWSANEQPDPEEKAKTYYLVASTFTTADKDKAIGYLKKAIAIKPNFGKSYLMLAQLYSNSGDCANDAFEKKSLNFLAAKTAARGGELDASIRSIAERHAQSFLKKAPSTAEIKDAKKGGKTITYKCYINESVVVPKP